MKWDYPRKPSHLPSPSFSLGLTHWLSWVLHHPTPTPSPGSAAPPRPPSLHPHTAPPKQGVRKCFPLSFGTVTRSGEDRVLAVPVQPVRVEGGRHIPPSSSPLLSGAWCPPSRTPWSREQPRSLGNSLAWCTVKRV